ncbi:sterile alpha motif domain-containing protein 12-like isoform X4 [Rhinatrema bivittatum]|uniref:sterile alpha motif domain-containing protein 12-like isoform X4 n=1 Tax=Rhinatrema bivittatum TaxID=194408 RepID=UPI0011299C67|nr:sterile alpha motif domain-containing protein 12-like isoform X4 [Rhinatrema bivittatum]
MAHLLQGCRGGEVQTLGSLEKSVSQWTVEDVCDWLRSGSLEERDFLVEVVGSHAISGRALLRLTDQTLKRMGFHQKSQRHEVLQAVLELRLQQELEDLMDIIDDSTPYFSRGVARKHSCGLPFHSLSGVTQAFFFVMGSDGIYPRILKEPIEMIPP